MAEIIKMPKMSDTMQEGVIAAWHKKVGDSVKSGDVLAEVETDKATMDLEAYEEGTLLYVGAEKGQSVPVNGLLAIIGKKGEDISGLLPSSKNGNDRSIDSPSDQKSNKQTTLETTSQVVQKQQPTNVNAKVISMPKMSDTMQEGTIAAWHKKVGDLVKPGDVLAEVETDKATMDLEAYEEGTLLYVGAEKGQSVPVDGVLAIVGEKGANFQSLLQEQHTEPIVEQEKTMSKPIQETSVWQSPSSKTFEEQYSNADRLFISPLAKRLAREAGIDPKTILGTGESGRVIRRDIEKAIQSGTKLSTAEKVIRPTIMGEEAFEEVPVSQMRKTIARRLAESKYSAPHFYLTMEVDMGNIVESRERLNEVSPIKISFNDIVIKAAAAALRQHPKINTSWLGEKIRYNKHIHIGVAVAVEEGLLVPVVRFADSKTLSAIAFEVKELGQKAKNKQLQPADWEGNTFTISNLGMFGIEEFTAIINPPDACILAVGGIKDVPIVKNGTVVPGKTMKITLSCDHRVVDGATGAAFLQTLKSLLEDPVRMLV